MASRRTGQAPAAPKEAAVVALLAATGVVAGFVAKVADSADTRALSDVANYPAAYVLGLALLARTAPTAPIAALRATAFFTSLCVAYYAWTSYVVGFSGGRYALAWLALALTFVPAAAAVLEKAYRSRAALPGLAVAVAAAGPLTEGPLHQLWLAWARGLDMPLLHPVQAAVGLAVAAVLIGVLPRDRRTRAAALLWLLPAAWVAQRASDAVWAAVPV